MSCCQSGFHIRFGKNVFLECGCLTGISQRECGENERFQPELLAAAVRDMDAYCNPSEPFFAQESLFPNLRHRISLQDGGYDKLGCLSVKSCDISVGSREWLSKWDARLAALPGAPDQEGYSRQVLCGEEDYGSTDLAAYISERRKGKVRLVNSNESKKSMPPCFSS